MLPRLRRRDARRAAFGDPAAACALLVSILPACVKDEVLLTILTRTNFGPVTALLPCEPRPVRHFSHGARGSRRHEASLCCLTERQGLVTGMLQASCWPSGISSAQAAVYWRTGWHKAVGATERLRPGTPDPVVCTRLPAGDLEGACNGSCFSCHFTRPWQGDLNFGLQAGAWLTDNQTAHPDHLHSALAVLKLN